MGAAGVTFTSQEGNLPSLLVQTTQAKMAATAIGWPRTAARYKGPTRSLRRRERARPRVRHPDLQALREYFVRVSATRSGGWSMPTVAAFSAPAAQPPSQPRDVRVTVAAGPQQRQRRQLWPDTPEKTGGSKVNLRRAVGRHERLRRYGWHWRGRVGWASDSAGADGLYCASMQICRARCSATKSTTRVLAVMWRAMARRRCRVAWGA